MKCLMKYLGDLICKFYFVPAVELDVQVWPPEPVPTQSKLQETSMATVTLPADHKVKVTLGAPKDRYGNVGQLDPNNPPKWSVSDPALLQVQPAADNMSAYFVPVGPTGTVQGKVVADTDLTEAVSEVTALIDFQIVAGQVVDLGPSVGPIEPQ